jgi:Na+/proline symporter
MEPEPVVRWEPETPRRRPFGPLGLAVLALAAALVAIRLVGALGGSGYDVGYAIGMFVIGPILLGLLAWWLALPFVRRRNQHARFASPGLATTIATIAVLVALVGGTR